jgi:hypothetical protein
MKSFLFLVLILTGIYSHGQKTCGSETINTNTYSKASQQTQSDILSYTQISYSSATIADSILKIPVVFHIVHKGETIGTGSNISDYDVLDALSRLNSTFRDSINSVNMKVEFVLPKRNPYGCPTNGINRIDGRNYSKYVNSGIKGSGASGLAIMTDHSWPQSDYYNIMIFHNINENIAGFAYYPYGGEGDGTYIDLKYLFTSTLPHEVGHGFHLHHTFEGDNNGSICPSNTNCSVNGDAVCDTPPHRRGDCGSTPCGSGNDSNYTYNILSYCHLKGKTRNRFTLGQKDRFRAVALGSIRGNLVDNQVLQNPDIQVNLDIKDVTCHALSNGSIELEAPCTYSNYTYSWNDVTSNATFRENLPAGEYTLTITSQDSKTLDTTITISEPSPLSPNFSGDSVICQGEKITVIQNPTGGSPILCDQKTLHTFNQTPSSIVSFDRTSSPISDEVRFQMLYTSDELADMQIDTGKVSRFDLNIYYILGTSTAYDLKIKLVHTSSTSLNNFINTDSVYQNTLTNYSLADGWNSFNLDQPFYYDGSSNLVIEVVCVARDPSTQGPNIFFYTTANNSVVTRYNGTTNTGIKKRPMIRLEQCTDTKYSYLWSQPRKTPNSIEVSDSGRYTVAVLDANDCADTFYIDITLSENPVYSLAIDASCDACGGTLAVSITNPTGNELLQINDSTYLDHTLSNLCSGTYHVAISNTYGCRTVDSIDLLNYTPILPTFSTPKDTIKDTDPRLALIGEPRGGMFSGSGVLDTSFTPSEGILGWNTIVYTYADSNGCSMSVSDSIFVKHTLHSYNPSKTALKIYPNPTDKFIFIETLDNHKNVTVNLHDALGQRVNTRETATSKGVRIDVQSLTAGMYFVEIRSGEMMQREKIMVRNL